MMDTYTAIFFTILTPAIGLLGTLLGAHISNKTQLKISEKEREDRFKLAALDKRLEVHQKAYILWNNLRWSLSKSDKREEAIAKCQEWWLENCLYLDKKSMEYFHKSYVQSINFEQNYKQVNEVILQTGKYIAEGVCLPFLYDEKAK